MFFFSSRRRHTRCALVTGVQTCALPILTQSRQALLSVVDALGPHDRIQVLRFGSTLAPLFRRPLLATAQVRDALRELAPGIDADQIGRASCRDRVCQYV